MEISREHESTEVLVECADPQIIFQSVHRGVCPRQMVLISSKTFIPLGLVEKEKPFHWLGKTKSHHVLATSLPDSSVSL